MCVCVCICTHTCRFVKACHVFAQEVKRAIHFYTKAQCYTPAIQLAKVRQSPNQHTVSTYDCVLKDTVALTKIASGAWSGERVAQFGTAELP